MNRQARNEISKNGQVKEEGLSVHIEPKLICPHMPSFPHDPWTNGVTSPHARASAKAVPAVALQRGRA